MLRVIMLSVVMLKVNMLKVNMLKVNMLNVVMLNDAARALNVTCTLLTFFSLPVPVARFEPSFLGL
jgi:hypothetical protein